MMISGIQEQSRFRSFVAASKPLDTFFTLSAITIQASKLKAVKRDGMKTRGISWLRCAQKQNVATIKTFYNRFSFSEKDDACLSKGIRVDKLVLVCWLEDSNDDAWHRERKFPERKTYRSKARLREWQIGVRWSLFIPNEYDMDDRMDGTIGTVRMVGHIAVNCYSADILLPNTVQQWPRLETFKAKSWFT